MLPGALVLVDGADVDEGHYDRAHLGTLKLEPLAKARERALEIVELDVSEEHAFQEDEEVGGAYGVGLSTAGLGGG